MASTADHFAPDFMYAYICNIHTHITFVLSEFVRKLMTNLYQGLQCMDVVTECIYCKCKTSCKQKPPENRTVTGIMYIYTHPLISILYTCMYIKKNTNLLYSGTHRHVVLTSDSPLTSTQTKQLAPSFTS